MNKGYFLTIITLLLISSISAELLMSPNPLEAEAKINQVKSYNLTLTNTFNFKIKSFTFNNLTGFTFPAIELNPNETKTINFSILRDKIYSGEIVSEVSFKYLVDIPEEPVTHYINMTTSGFHPDFLTIHNGDTVIWHNDDDISHTVTGANFDYDLPINGTVQHIFNQLGTIDYQDMNTFWGARIEVLSRDEEQEVNNPSYNKILRVNLNIFSDPTELSMNLVDKDFTVEATGSEEGLLSIENTGNEVGQKVELSSDSEWIVFDENNFNIDKGKKNFVTFKIQPIVFSTNETNKTYEITIKAKGLNTPEYIDKINVFIPYSETLEQFDSNEGFLSWFTNVFCPQNPNLFICNTSVTSQGSQIIVKDPEIPINLSASQFYAFLRRQQRMEDSLQRSTNRENQLADFIETEIPKLTNLVNQSLKESKTANDRSTTTERVFWIIAIFCVLIIGFFMIWNPIAKVMRSKHLMEGSTT